MKKVIISLLVVLVFSLLSILIIYGYKYYKIKNALILVDVVDDLEIDVFTDVNGTTPLLLLDDIFSELDLRKRNKLLKFISSREIQSILTTTDLKNISKKYLDDSYIYEVKEGKIERK